MEKDEKSTHAEKSDKLNEEHVCTCSYEQIRKELSKLYTHEEFEKEFMRKLDEKMKEYGLL